MGLAIGLMLEETAMYASESSESRQDTAYSTVAWRQARERVVASVKLLPERERQIIVLHYFHALAFDQIALVFGLSKGRISQIHREALLRLRELLGPIDQFLLTR
jgi:RNA polymerase sigma factor for flagellar operon FliA